MANSKRIQILRNEVTALNEKELSYFIGEQGLWKKPEFIAQLKDGEQVLGRYKKTIQPKEGGQEKIEYHTIYGIVHKFDESQDTTTGKVDYIEVFKSDSEIGSSSSDLNFTDRPEVGQYVSAVNQNAGLIAPKRVHLPIKSLSEITEDTEKGISILTGVKLNTSENVNEITPSKRKLQVSERLSLTTADSTETGNTITLDTTSKIFNDLTVGKGLSIIDVLPESSSDGRSKKQIDLKLNANDFEIPDDGVEGVKDHVTLKPYKAGDSSINITGKAVKVNLADTSTTEPSALNDNILHLKEDLAEGKNGLYSNIFIKKTDNPSDNVNASVRYQLIDKVTSKPLGAPIDFPKDRSLGSVELVYDAPVDSQGKLVKIETETEEAPNKENKPVPIEGGTWKAGQFLRFEYILNNTQHVWVYINVSEFLTQAEFRDGLHVNANGTVETKLGNGLEFGVEDSLDEKRKPVQIKLKENSGLTLDAGGLTVGSSDGIYNAGGNVAVRNGWGIDVINVGDNPNAQASNHLNVGVTIQLRPGDELYKHSGLDLSYEGLRVKPSKSGGLELQQEGVENADGGVGIKLHTYINSDRQTVNDSGLMTDADGLKIKTGKGLIIGEDGISINATRGIKLINEEGETNIGKLGLDLLGVAGGLAGDETNYSKDPNNVSGLRITKENTVAGEQVSVKPNTKKGIMVDKDGVAVKLKENGGLTAGTASEEGISVNNDNKSIVLNNEGKVEVGTVDCGFYPMDIQQ